MFTEKQYREASRRSGVPVGLLKLVDSQEGNGTSRAGAHGEMQLMPGTAAGLERKYRINTRTPYGNLLGGAYYLAQQFHTFKNWKLALAAYNAGPGAVHDYGGIPPYHETQNYVSSIMSRWRAGNVATRARANITGTPEPSSPINTRALALQGLEHLSQGNYDPVAQLEALHQQMLKASKPPTEPITTAPLPNGGGDWHKFVILAKGADRAGVHTQPGVLQFVGELGSRMGRKLSIGTGTNHNEFVVGTKRQSAHWTGHAADIPAAGKALTRLGRQALILAGMSPQEAAKVKGGLFNIGGYQIIFNTNEGGNHFNHLHVGLRGST